MGFSHVSQPVRTLTGKTFARKFITLGRVINYWADAVGPELAAKTYPIGMKVRKVTKNGTTNLFATLEIAASSSDATLVHYQKGLILERLRTLLAADMIEDIRVTHAAQKTIAPARAASAPLTAQQKTCVSPLLSDALNKVSDDELRAILDRMAEGVATRNPLPPI